MAFSGYGTGIPMRKPLITNTAPLRASGNTPNDTYVSSWIDTNFVGRIVGSIFADQAGTIYIEQSPDKINPDISTTYSVSANNGEGFDESILLPWARVRFVNTASSDQTVFRIYAYFI